MKARRTKRRAKSSSFDKAAGKLLDSLKRAPVGLTENVLDEIEAAHRDDTFGPVRRAALVILLETGAGHLEKIEGANHEQAVAIAVFYEYQLRYLRALQQLVKLLETSTSRTMLALCWRKDCDVIRREAAAQIAKEAPGS